MKKYVIAGTLVVAALAIVFGGKPHKGSASVNPSAGRTSCEWVQLWEGGPKWATFNVGATITDYANLTTEADATPYYDTDQSFYYNTANVGGLYAWSNPNLNGRKATWTGDEPTGIADVATMLWGNNWRTPTKIEFSNLHSDTYTTWTWCDGSCTQYVPGCILKGYKVSGVGSYADKSIFLPAADQFNYQRCFVLNGSGYGCYWSSTVDDSDYAYCWGIESDRCYMFNGGRRYGCSVRAVLAE